MATPLSISIKTLYGFELLLAAELESLGLKDIQPGNRLVQATGSLADLYRCNLHLRTALRVLVPIANFHAPHPDALYRQAIKIEWTDYLDQQQTFAIEPNVHSKYYRHAHYASLKMKDAIADHFTRKFGHRPDVDPSKPDVLFNLHIDHDRVTISLDSSGDSLNRRGYRLDGGEAPLNEVLAAGMLLLTGWKADSAFYDPMCGSGTLAIEAALMATHTAPGLLRKEFGFTSWRTFDSALWKQLRSDAGDQIIPAPAGIFASDMDPIAIKTTRRNVEAAGFQDIIHVEQKDFFECAPSAPGGLLVMNPPYGERIRQEDAVAFYKTIGSRLKHFWPGFSAWIISSNKEALKHIGLKPSQKFNLLNGALECQWNRFDLFAGTARDARIGIKPQ